mgnify:CR=1 FL=1
MSATHNWFESLALNRRLTRSLAGVVTVSSSMAITKPVKPPIVVWLPCACTMAMVRMTDSASDARNAVTG